MPKEILVPENSFVLIITPTLKLRGYYITSISSITYVSLTSNGPLEKNFRVVFAFFSKK